MLLALLLLPSGLLGFQLPLADPRYSPAIFTPLSPFLYNFPQFPQPVLYTGQVRQAAAEVRTPLRAAVEQWPSQAERAQTRLLDYLALGREACQEGTYRPASSCSQYQFCVHGEWTTQNCQTNLHWDNTNQVCNFPERAACEPGVEAVISVSDGNEDGEAPPPLPVEPVIAEEEIAINPPSPPTTQRPSTTTPDWNKPWMPPTPPPLPNYDDLPLTNGLSGDYKIVCYFTNWATYRQGGQGKFDPEHIDPNICTHIIYGFAVLDSNTLLMKSHDPYADLTDGYSGKDMYRKVHAFKKHGIKVTLALGGWNDSKGSKYSKLVNSPTNRAKFISHALEFIEKYDFDGLDLDWEYPSCWQTECKEENYKDKAAFTAWVAELSAAFKPRGLLLSAAVSPSKTIMDVGYDIPAISQYLDWINVMTYDYHGQWDKKTGHVAPFLEHPDDDFSYFNANFTMNYWHESGCPKSKLVMGMPLYGQSFTLASAADNKLNAPARSGGAAGPATRAKGFLAYHEICRNVAAGWQVVQDPQGRMGPYAYKGDQWVGWDDVAMIKRKSQYVRDQGFGGGMVWALDLDDFRNLCGAGRYPLMNTMREVLGPAKR